MSKRPFFASGVRGGGDKARGLTNERVSLSEFEWIILITGDKGGGGRSAALAGGSIGGGGGRMAGVVARSGQVDPCSCGSKASPDGLGRWEASGVAGCGGGGAVPGKGKEGDMMHVSMVRVASMEVSLIAGVFLRA